MEIFGALKVYISCSFFLKFILFKEFFGAILDNLGKIEDYLIIIKYILINLKAKNLELLNKFIIT